MRVDGTVSTVSFPNAYVLEAGPQQLTWPSVRFPWGNAFMQHWRLVLSWANLLAL